MLHPETVWCSRCEKMDVGSLLYTGSMPCLQLPTHNGRAVPFAVTWGPPFVFAVFFPSLFFKVGRQLFVSNSGQQLTLPEQPEGTMRSPDLSTAC